MKPVIIFDFGGVIMKTFDYTYRHKWDDKLSLAHGTVERIVHGSNSWRKAQKGQIDIETYWSDVADQLNLSPTEIAQLKQDFYEGDTLDQEVLKIISQLRENNYAVGLLSNDSPELRTKLDRLNLIQLFEIIVISGEIGVMKPDVEAYTVILNEFEISPQQAIFIDDMSINIEAANKLGIHGIHYTPDIDLDNKIQQMINAIEANAKSS